MLQHGPRQDDRAAPRRARRLCTYCQVPAGDRRGSEVCPVYLIPPYNPPCKNKVEYTNYYEAPAARAAVWACRSVARHAITPHALSHQAPVTPAHEPVQVRRHAMHLRSHGAGPRQDQGGRTGQSIRYLSTFRLSPTIFLYLSHCPTVLLSLFFYVIKTSLWLSSSRRPCSTPARRRSRPGRKR